jgi:hypothetical protein
VDVSHFDKILKSTIMNQIASTKMDQFSNLNHCLCGQCGGVMAKILMKEHVNLKTPLITCKLVAPPLQVDIEKVNLVSWIHLVQHSVYTNDTTLQNVFNLDPFDDVLARMDVDVLTTVHPISSNVP